MGNKKILRERKKRILNESPSRPSQNWPSIYPLGVKFLSGFALEFLPFPEVKSMESIFQPSSLWKIGHFPESSPLEKAKILEQRAYGRLFPEQT